MPTYLLRIDETFPEKCIGKYLRDSNPDRFLFLSGAPIDVAIKPLKIAFNASVLDLSFWDALATDANLFLVFPRLADLFQDAAGNDVQMLRAIAMCNDGELTNCHVMNITCRAHCIDHARSLYTRMSGSPAILSFQRLVLKECCLGPHAIARESEYLPYVLVSASLRQAIVASQVRGIRAILPEELPA